MTSDSLRGCFNCAHCAAKPDHAPFALVSKYRFGSLAVDELNGRYGICCVHHFVVELDAMGTDTPCALMNYERRS